MSAFDALVCLDGGAITNLDAAIGVIMEPFKDAFDGEGCYGWRSWEILAPRWGRLFVHPRIGQSGSFDSQNSILLGRHVSADAAGSGRELCVGGSRSNLDLAASRREAAASARYSWELWHSYSINYPEALSMRDLLSGDGDGSAPRGETQAEVDFNRQPLISALSDLPDPVHWQAPAYQYRHLYRHFRTGFKNQHDLVRHFAFTQEDFIAHEESRALAGDVLITVDGRWIQAPEVEDYFSCARGDECLDLVGHQGYCELVDRYIEDLPAEAIVVQLVCKY